MDSMIQAGRSLIRAAALTALSLVAAASSAAGAPAPKPLGAGHQPLSAGVHVLDLVSREQPAGSGPQHLPRIAITLPSGWFNYDGWGMNDGGTLIVSFWDVAKVYATPCRWQSRPKIDPGPTVDGLASVLARRPLRQATRPRDAVLGGFRGKYLMWSVPQKMDLSRCGQGYFESWTARGWASDRYQQGPGQVDRLWILDVKGQRLVVDAAYMPSATRKQRAELDRIVHSITFAPGSSRRLAAEVSGPRVQGLSVAGINNRGEIVGSLTTDGGAHRGHYGFVWSKGSLRLIGAAAAAINGRGRILGYANYPNVNGPTRPVLWGSGKTTNVGLASVSALNDRGEVIGSQDDRHAALWTNGSVRVLPFVSPFVEIDDRGEVAGSGAFGQAAAWRDGKLTVLGPGDPIAINDRGEIVGNLNGHVILWRNGASSDLGPGWPVAINEHGEIAGVHEAQGEPHAFLWRNGVTTDLGTLGSKGSFPTAISNSGQVVGESWDADGLQRGFVWQNGTMTALPAPRGSAGQRTRAIAINDHDQIVGDDCFGDCELRGGPPNRFIVLWTLRGRRIETLRVVGLHHRLRRRSELDRNAHSIKLRADSLRRLASARSNLEVSRPRSIARNGPWIAYSTSPACGAYGCPSTGEQDSGGSDVFVTRVGGIPKLVAGRDRGKTWNVCPAFSPNGRMLAFVRVTGTTGWRDDTARSTIVVVSVGAHGPSGAQRRVFTRPGDRPRCPRWSSDSSRLAYLDRGKLVVRSLDGSRRHWASGDPTLPDFHGSATAVVSPTGELVARLDSAKATVVVARADGSDQRTIPDDLQGYPSYAIAAWSPDGRKLLLAKDVGGFSLRAVSVDSPFASETVVTDVPVNNARAWPGYGDVSWQPISRRRIPSAAPDLAGNDVTVSDINDRGQVVGTLWADGGSSGFVWRRGSLRLLGGGPSMDAFDINDHGQILGSQTLGVGLASQRSVLWENGVMTELGLTFGAALNDRGQVLGGILVPQDGNGYEVNSAVWTNGNLRFLPIIDTAAINDRGQVVGMASDGDAAEWQDGVVTDLGPGSPRAINDRGEILGSRGGDVILWRKGIPTDIGPGIPLALNARGEVLGVHGGYAAPESVAFVWRNNTTTDLGTLGGKWSYPTAISSRGQVVGYSVDRRGKQHGFVWQNGTMTVLPAPPGHAGQRTRAIAINDHNQIIGDSCPRVCQSRPGPPDRFAVLWTLRGRRIETVQIMGPRRRQR